MGRRWTATGSGTSPTLATNRYRYNGKEEQALAAGMPYTDYGSRFFDPDHYTWLSPDPLSGKYPGVYPYAFCAGDPVNYVDPDGKFPYPFPFWRPGRHASGKTVTNPVFRRPLPSRRRLRKRPGALHPYGQEMDASGWDVA
jgi:RHS repeat-associated protein